MGTPSPPTQRQNDTNTVVFILSATRSGSTWLSYALGSHSQATHLGEYYRPFTFANHVACRLCEAKGRDNCEFLHGIHQVESQYAYDFAFSRFGTPFLIDCSKNLDWLAKFINQDRFQVKVIHLIREPRGWFASEKRRRAGMTATTGMEMWLNLNVAIVNFIKHYRLTSMPAYYDELATDEEKYFPSVCEFIGIPFERTMLKYWEYEHHALGGNGAAFNVIGGYQDAKVTTGDDAFYRLNARRQFYDTRWRSQLSPEEVRTIENMPTVRQFLERFQRDFAHFDRLAEAAHRKGVS